MDQSAERVIVIGAGMVGVAAALWLQRAGRRVTLIDREGPAAGASYGNGGVLAAASIVPVPTKGITLKAPGMLFNPNKPLFMRWSYLPRLLPFLARYLANAAPARVAKIADGLSQLLHDTADQHRALAEGTPAARFVEKGDYIFCYADRAAYEADAYAWGLRRDRGHPFEEMEADALAAYDPALKGRFGFAVRCPDHGRISDPGAYVTALAEELERLGGEVVVAEARDIALENGRAVGVVTDKGLMAAAEVVVTTGAWSGPLARRLGVTMPLEAERGYHLEFVNPTFTPRAPLMVAAGKFVATPMEGRLRCAGVVEFGGLDAPPSAGPFALLRRQVAELFPELEYDSVEEWMGHRPATADSLPMIGRAPAAPNVWLGYGHQHIGLSAGPKTGRWLAQLITGQTPNADLGCYSPDRPPIQSA